MAADIARFGKLVIVGKEGFNDLEFPLDKKSILIGRDHSCDIRIVNKEISRKHAEVYVEDTGAVFISSMGREPVTVNGAPVTSPLELATGDKIEVLLENRTRVFYFQGDDETVQIRAPPARQPLGDTNAAPLMAAAGKPALAAKGPAPAPLPPPPPPPGVQRAGRQAAAAPRPEPSAQPAAAPAAMVVALQDAIKAGVQLKKVQPAADKTGPATDNAAGGMFVPNPADLLKLKAGLRKTALAAAPGGEEASPQQEQATAMPEAPAVSQAEEAMEEAAQPAIQEPKPAVQMDAKPMETDTVLDEEEPAAPAVVEGPVPVAAEPAAEEAQPEQQPANAAVEPVAEAEGNAATADAAVPEAVEAPAVQPAVAAVEEPAANVAAPDEQAGMMGSAVRKQKSVRFHVEEEAAQQQQQRVAGTPEGAARDATITIRLRRGDVEQFINVDDNTVALAQWGLGTMGEPLEELPDTVVSKRSRHSIAAPASAGKTPIRSALRELLLATSPAISNGGAQATPGVMGPAAPAPTPATGAAQVQSQADRAPPEVVVDSATLAAKLAEVAEQHDVTVEVPAGFFSPTAAGKDGLRVALTPKSKGRTPAASTAGPAHDGRPTSAAKRVMCPAGRSRLSQVGVAVPPASVGPVSSAANSLERTRENQVPAEVLAATVAQASAKKQAHSAIRRCSLSRTPGAKIVIVEQATQTTPASARAASSTKHAASAEATPHLLSTIAIQTEAEDEGDDVEQVAVQEQSDEGGSADGSLELEEAAESVPLKQYQRVVLRAKAYHCEARQLAAQLRRMIAKATKLKKAASALSGALDQERARRQELQEAMQQVVLNRVAAELEEQAAAVEGEGEAAEVEMEEAGQEEAEAEVWAPRVVVLGKLSKGFSTVQQAGQVVVVRPTHLAMPAAAPTPPSEVVLLPASARKTPVPSAAQLACMLAPSAVKGRTSAAAATPGKGRTPTAASVAKSGGVLELPKSMLRESPGTGGAARVVLESVELPCWLFDSEQQASDVEAAVVVATEAEVSTETAEVEAPAPAVEAVIEEQQLTEAAAAQLDIEVDDLAARASQQAQAAAADEAAAEASGSDVEEEGEDVCHLCGQSNEGDILLLCDSCDNACHLSCCIPPLKRVPKGDWFCVECAAKQATKAATAKAKLAAKRSGKRQAEEVEEESADKSAGRVRRGAAAAAADELAEDPVKGGQRHGSKRAAEQEPAASEPFARGKRARAAAAPKASEEAAPLKRTLRGKATTSSVTEVSTRRCRAAAAAPKAEASAPSRSTRSRR